MSSSIEKLSPIHVGFVSTRFAGNDGVSLETDKWASVLDDLGHTSFFFAGESDKAAEASWVVPEAHFQYPAVAHINQVAFGQRTRPPGITQQIQSLKEGLKAQIDRFIRHFDIRLLVVENALAIPLNLPLGLALTEYIAETGFPTIAHHHDFFWERKRFLVNCVWDYLNMAFPPHLPFIRHVVINSSAANQLSLRTGISSLIIPNVMDFEHGPPPPDGYAADLGQSLGMLDGGCLILQPTRVVQRKGIEHAIELVSRLENNATLVISHATGDEGYAYEQYLRRYAARLGVKALFISDIIQRCRGKLPDGRKIYTLGDVYQDADLITYPSDLEGFGNAFLEAVFYRKPVVVNNYSIFNTDIKPKGFQVIEFDGYISEDTVFKSREVLRNPEMANEMVENNYRLARRYYSYSVLERRFVSLLSEFFGE